MTEKMTSGSRKSFIFGGVGVAAVAIAIAACSPSSPKLVPRPAPGELHKNTSTTSFDPKVDILFVIDNSGSMSSHQQNLAANVAKFAQGILSNAILDYHIGVITTSVTDYGSPAAGENGMLYGNEKWVDRSTSGAMQVLASNMLVGLSGSGEEKMFDPIAEALSPELTAGYNQGFYREKAQLAVIFITDAEDQSSNHDENSMWDFLLKLKNHDTSQILTYAVYIPTQNSNPSCPRDDSNMLPTRLESFLTLSNAKSFNICDVDYGNKLAQLGDDLARRIGRVILLDRIPDLATVKVSFGTQEIPRDSLAGWGYDPKRNAIVLGPNLAWTQQPTGTQLDVRFEAIDLNPPKQ